MPASAPAAAPTAAPANPPAAPAVPTAPQPPATPPVAPVTPAPEPTPGVANLFGGDPAAPAAVEVKLPDGMNIPDTVMAALKAGAKDSAGAQALVDAFATSQKAEAEADQKAFEARKQEWAKQTETDPEIGGAKHPATIANATKAFTKFGSPALVKLLVDTGLQRHPEVVRCFAAMGAAMAEDNVSGTGGGAAGPTSKEAAYRKAFPNTPARYGGGLPDRKE
jgi:hypothetical protein